MSRPLQACDACKRRKVRCNGAQACQQCTHLNLKCNYSESASSARSRRNIARGSVIDTYRDASFSSQGDVPPQLAPRTASSVSCNNHPQPNHPASFEPDFFSALFVDYLTCVFPFLPIISDSDLRASVRNVDFDQDDAAFVHALAAVTMNMTRVGPKHSADNLKHVTLLCTRALELRGTIMPEASMTIKSTMTPLLVSICLFAKRQNINMGFYYLREAITRIQIIRGNDSGIFDMPNAEERAQGERLYWVLFMHERFVAVTYNRSIALPVLRELPRHESSTETGVIEGFNCLIQLFSVIDAEFIAHWLDRQSPSMTFLWIEKKQLDLGSEMDIWEREISPLTDMQQIDLIVTRHWLHTLLWQMALSKFLLSSSLEGEEFMSIIFPIRLSHRLRSILAATPREAIEIHGTGIVQKIFDITNTIADILGHVPAATTNNKTDTDHLDDFLFLYRFLLAMSKFYPVEKVVLRAKLETLQSLFPCLGNMDT